MNCTLCASLMCADLLNLADEINRLTDDGVDMLHIDIMDPCFVPNIAFGIDTVKAIRKATTLPLDVHIMAKSNEFLIDEFIKIGCERISFHISDGDFAIRLLRKIRENNLLAGVALSPTANESILKYVKDYIDFVIIMGVEPGFACQSIAPCAFSKVASARLILGEGTDITVDGNMSVDNGVKCVKNGANTLVAGTSFAFNDEGYVDKSIRIARVNIDKYL